MIMDLNLLPGLTVLMIGFIAMAAVGLVTLLVSTTLFFTQNHAVRVRRHEGIRSYYGHLAMGR
jgi:uncharacterized protein (DUF58 family)